MEKWEMIEHHGKTTVPSQMHRYSFGTNGTNKGIIASYDINVINLVAVAPELLEALQRLLRQYEALCDAIPNSKLLMTEKAVVNAKTVISKVKGGQQ
uniref:Uncharacterized protein n=1 Tax=viral metagenome TaxID=1070528 RepID=A0A6M3LMY1_9ZZZZ